MAALAGKRVALVSSGGGGARSRSSGSRAFEEAGLEPAEIVGCSGGAIWGSMWAAEERTRTGSRPLCRGTSLFHVQLLLGCTALNVKRLATRGDAASGQAAGPATAQAAPGEGTAEAPAADLAAHNHLARDLTRGRAG